MTTAHTTTHDEYRAELAEHALGILDGRARAALLAHLEACDECADEVAALANAADSLVRVPVGVEPPVGFETRTLQRITAEEAPKRRRRVATLALAAAVVALSFGVGLAVEHLAQPAKSVSATGRIEQRSLSAGSRSVGTVYAFTGSPSWMFVSLDAPGAPAKVRCIIVTTSGRDDLGTFALDAGRGSWAASLPVAVSAVREIELTSLSGAVIAHLASSGWSSGAWPY